jgi:homoserine O-acetyltransferase/O-succinyltransferase
VFLDGLEAALTADARWREGRCSSTPVRGLRAFARVYAGWAYSPRFYRDGLFRDLGWPTLESLYAAWEDDHLAIDPNDLMTLLRSWSLGNVADNSQFNGDLSAALGAIRARTILLACSTDRYFPPEDNEVEASLIPNCRLEVLQSDFGHCALSPGRVPTATAVLETLIAELLGDEVPIRS